METPPAPPSQAEVNRALWSACDTFRGAIDPDQYKNYILTFLFFKYVSDVWRDAEARYTAEFDDPELVARKMKRLPFVIPEGQSFYDVAENRNDPELGQRINVALAAIEDANYQRLEGVFRGIDFNHDTLGAPKDRNRRLQELIANFDRPLLDFRPSVTGTRDLIGDAYQYLIAHFAADAGKKGGEFYTPRAVSTLLARLLDPQPGERIADPAIGSGSLAIAVAEAVGSRDVALYGQESNGATWALCKMNMILHGFDAAQIAWGDSLTTPKLLDKDTGRPMTFDVVVANPPFSLKRWGHEAAASDPFDRYHRGLPPKSKGDYAFLSHIVATMDPHDGRAAVIVPHGVLFRGGAEGRIRRAFLEEGLIEAVIGLPEKLFFGTGIPAAVLVFNRDRTSGDVLFVDASSGFEAGSKQNVLRKEDIAHIAETYRAFRADPEGGVVDKFSARADLDAIRGNDFNLNIPRYVDTFEPEPEVDVAAAQQRLVELDRELAAVRREMDEHLDALGLLAEVPDA